MEINETLNVLKNNDISYEIEYHNAVFTVEEAKKVKLSIKGQECKNLFLKANEKYYLYILPDEKRANLKQLANYLEVKKLSFGSEEELRKKLSLTKGSVTPLGVINDNGSITIIIDKDIREKFILVHPNSNLATISIKYNDLIKLFSIYGNTYLEYKNEQ